MNRKLWVALLLVLPGCASAPPAQPPAPKPALAYAIPTPATATYTFSDSSTFTITAAAIGNIEVGIKSTGTAGLTFAPKATDFEVTIQLTKFNGSMVNSQMGGGPSATEADVQGPAVLTLTPRGVATLTTKPKLNQNAQQLGVSEGFFRRFFVRLPGTPVRTGASWTDVIASTDSTGTTVASVLDTVTSTLVGDTLVNGRTLARITSVTRRTLSITGTNQGVEIAQKLNGTANATTLWDNERHLVVDRVEYTTLTGTFDLPQMGMNGLPVNAKGYGRMSLRQP